jgi:hypothetical protein
MHKAAPTEEGSAFDVFTRIAIRPRFRLAGKAALAHLFRLLSWHKPKQKTKFICIDNSPLWGLFDYRLAAPVG